MEWLPPIKDFWWLYTTIVVVISGFIKLVTKANFYKQQVMIVQEHESEIKDIGKRLQGIESETAALKEGVQSIQSSLTQHSIEQKEDIRALFDVMFSTLDMLREIKDAPGLKDELKEVHDKLRRRQLEK